MWSALTRGVWGHVPPGDYTTFEIISGVVLRVNEQELYEPSSHSRRMHVLNKGVVQLTRALRQEGGEPSPQFLPGSTPAQLPLNISFLPRELFRLIFSCLFLFPQICGQLNLLLERSHLHWLGTPSPTLTTTGQWCLEDLLGALNSMTHMSLTWRHGYEGVHVHVCV